MVYAFFPPAPRSQRQVDLCEFKANLVYRTSSRTARAVYKETLSQKQNKTKQKFDLGW